MTTPEQRAKQAVDAWLDIPSSNDRDYTAGLPEIIADAIRAAEADARANERERIEADLMEAMEGSVITIREVCELIQGKAGSNPR